MFAVPAVVSCIREPTALACGTARNRPNWELWCSVITSAQTKCEEISQIFQKDRLCGNNQKKMLFFLGETLTQSSSVEFLMRGLHPNTRG